MNILQYYICIDDDFPKNASPPQEPFPLPKNLSTLGIQRRILGPLQKNVMATFMAALKASSVARTDLQKFISKPCQLSRIKKHLTSFL